MIQKAATKFSILLSVMLALTGPISVGATNSDAAKEQRWAEQVIDGLLDGDELWLVDDTGHEFLGILTEGGSNSGHAVVLIHGLGVHPNWPDVIYPLRQGLLEQGITTLSIQMPILANDADPRDYALLFSEVPGRVEAALNFLIDKSYRNTTLVAHSLGAAMATYYLSQSEADKVTSLVVIGMGPGILGSENISALEKVNIAVLDLYGSEDLEPVVDSAERRAVAGVKGMGQKYRQLRVVGAGHFFQEYEDILLRTIVEWLDTQSD